VEKFLTHGDCFVITQQLMYHITRTYWLQWAQKWIFTVMQENLTNIVGNTAGYGTA